MGRSVAEFIKSHPGAPVKAGWEAVRSAWYPSDIRAHVLGGHLWDRAGEPPVAITLDPGVQRAVAAIQLLGCRAVGGRTHGYYDHYGATPALNGIRAVVQTGVLSDGEINELENCIIQDAAACYYDDRLGAQRRLGFQRPGRRRAGRLHVGSPGEPGRLEHGLVDGTRRRRRRLDAHCGPLEETLLRFIRLKRTWGRCPQTPGIFGGISPVSNGTCLRFPQIHILELPGETESGSAGTQVRRGISRLRCANGASGP